MQKIGDNKCQVFIIKSNSKMQGCGAGGSEGECFGEVWTDPKWKVDMHAPS